MVFTISSLVIRFIAGKASDQYGRKVILKISLALLAVAMLWIGMAGNTFSLMSASALYGVATGMLSPTITAWTVDLSDPEHRGKAMATMYIALEAGIGTGALLAGWLFISDMTMIPYIFYSCTAITIMALIYLQYIYPLKKTA